MCGTCHYVLEGNDQNAPSVLIDRRSLLDLIAEYRSNYNKQIKEYNRYVRKFPTRMFLSMLGYETQDYKYLDYNAPVDAPQNLFGE